ncbi:MAG TPA: CxxC-x17-CxxC domain-containing protein [bacterium]|nr:CxxC-x17-CxxC domain-containing protein [bacterium]
MKKQRVKKAGKSTSKNTSVKAAPLPGIVEGIGRLVERLEGVERKMDQVLGRVSNFAAEMRSAVHNIQSVSSRANSGPHPNHGQATVRRDRVLYKAICADCRKECEVPFKPGDRPVYCKECFVLRKSGHIPRDPDERVHSKPAYTPGSLGPNAIPTLAENVSAFPPGKKKSRGKASRKTRKKR